MKATLWLTIILLLCSSTLAYEVIYNSPTSVTISQGQPVLTVELNNTLDTVNGLQIIDCNPTTCILKLKVTPERNLNFNPAKNFSGLAKKGDINLTTYRRVMVYETRTINVTEPTFKNNTYNFTENNCQTNPRNLPYWTCINGVFFYNVTEQNGTRNYSANKLGWYEEQNTTISLTKNNIYIYGLEYTKEPDAKVDIVPSIFNVSIDGWAWWNSTIETNLAVYYGFNHSSGTYIKDNSLHAHDGTADAAAKWVTGKQDNAINLPGDDFTPVGASFGNATIFNQGTGSFTHVFWYKANSSQGGRGVYGYAWCKQQAASPYKGTCLDVGLHGIAGAIYFVGYDGSGYTWQINNGASLSDNVWHHVVAIRDRTAGRVYIYVDNVIKANATEVGTNVDQTTGAYLGKRDTVTGQYSSLNSSIDEYAYYTYAWTPSIINQSYNEGNGLCYNCTEPPVTNCWTVGSRYLIIPSGCYYPLAALTWGTT